MSEDSEERVLLLQGLSMGLEDSEEMVPSLQRLSRPLVTGLMAFGRMLVLVALGPDQRQSMALHWHWTKLEGSWRCQSPRRHQSQGMVVRQPVWQSGWMIIAGSSCVKNLHQGQELEIWPTEVKQSRT